MDIAYFIFGLFVYVIAVTFFISLFHPKFKPAATICFLVISILCPLSLVMYYIL